MEYRKTTKADIDLLMELRLEMLRKVNNLPDSYKYTDELIECSRRYFLEGDQTTTVAFDGNRAAGCASISYIEIMPTFSHPTGKRAHIMNVYTRDEYRRQGVARKLVTMLINEAAERGVTEISLDATDMGKPLYITLGFENSGAHMAKIINNERT